MYPVNFLSNTRAEAEMYKMYVIYFLLLSYSIATVSSSSQSPINLGNQNGEAKESYRQYNSAVTFRPFVRKAPSYKEMIVRLARRYDMEKERLDKVDFPPTKTLRNEKESSSVIKTVYGGLKKGINTLIEAETPVPAITKERYRDLRIGNEAEYSKVRFEMVNEIIAKKKAKRTSKLEGILQAPPFEPDKAVVTTLRVPLFYYLFSPGMVKFAELFSNYDVRLCGGTVRDILLDLVPHVLDFAVDAKPVQIKRLLAINRIKILNIDGRLDTFTFRLVNTRFKITTLRNKVIDDGELDFVTRWEADAYSRDFTINSLYLGLDGSLYDYFNGLADLKEKRIAFIGDAEERIKSEPFLIMRYFRMFGLLADDPKIHDQHTLHCILEHQYGLGKVPGKRMWLEFQRILNGNWREDIVKKMLDLNLAEYMGLGHSEHLDIGAFEYLCRLKVSFKFRPITYVGCLLTSNDQVLEFITRMDLMEAETKLLKYVIERKEKSRMRG